MPRQPMELPLHREGAHFTAIVGQTLYTLGATNQPDLYDIDRRAGFQDGDLMHDHEAYSALLWQGLRICEYTTYCVERMAAEGLTYLRRYFEPWTPALEEYYTPETVDFYRYQAERFIQVVQSLPHGMYSRCLRPIGKMDVLSGIGRGAAVSLSVRHPSGQTQPVLVTPRGEEQEDIVGWLYDPAAQPNTVSRLQLNALWARANPAQGAAFISRT